jgi:hypothetical protein
MNLHNYTLTYTHQQEFCSRCAAADVVVDDATQSRSLDGEQVF